MSAVAYVSRDDAPPPRAKPLPRKLLTAGGGPPPGLPPALEYRNGARELLLRTLAPARALIAETCEKIPAFFGPGARFALEDVTDVGDETVTHMLYLVIGAELKAEDGGKALDRFLEEWWVDNLDRGEGTVHLGLELL